MLSFLNIKKKDNIHTPKWYKCCLELCITCLFYYFCWTVHVFSNFILLLSEDGILSLNRVRRTFVILTTTLTSTYTINIGRTLTLFVYIDVGIQSTRTTRSELQINFLFRCMEKRVMADFVPVVFAVVLVSVPSSAVQSTCTFSSDKLEIWFKER